MDIKIFFLSDKTQFSTFLNDCLKEDTFETNLTNRIKHESLEDNIVIINLLEKRANINKELDYVLESKCQKIILLENALDLYLNCSNKPPFSVYSELKATNVISQDLLEIEKRVKDSNKKYVIFRISEVYGPSIKNDLIHKLFHTRKQKLDNSKHDFIYEGDVMQALEISLKQTVCGLFDIASGKTESLKDLSEIVFKKYDIKNKIEWKIKKQKISFNCENFKFFGWQPIVDIEIGLKTVKDSL